MPGQALHHPGQDSRCVPILYNMPGQAMNMPGQTCQDRQCVTPARTAVAPSPMPGQALHHPGQDSRCVLPALAFWLTCQDKHARKHARKTCQDRHCITPMPGQALHHPVRTAVTPARRCAWPGEQHGPALHGCWCPVRRGTALPVCPRGSAGVLAAQPRWADPAQYGTIGKQRRRLIGWERGDLTAHSMRTNRDSSSHDGAAHPTRLTRCRTLRCLASSRSFSRLAAKKRPNDRPCLELFHPDLPALCTTPTFAGEN